MESERLPESRAFTRFALPFAYALQPTSASADPTYVQINPEKIAGIRDRRPYMTPEIASVLFGRSAWFHLEGSSEAASALKCSYLASSTAAPVEYSVALRPPRIVLFEGCFDSKPRPDPERDPLLVGFLLLDVDFVDYERVPLEALLEFNEGFRYLWPPFDDHLAIADRCFGKFVNARGRPLTEATVDADAYFRRWADLLSFPLRTQSGEMFALGPHDVWTVAAKAWLSGDDGPQTAGWIVYPDNRAFVWSGVQTPRGTSDLQTGTGLSSQWIKLLNVDRPGRGDSSQSSPFEIDWAESRTYRRWANNDTLYGFTAHSGVMVASSPPEDNNKEPDRLLKVFREQYFDLVLPLMYVRAATFRFSNELSRLSAEARDAGFSRSIASRFDNLRRSLMLLTNLYRYPLLSSQQQAVELYDCARRQLDVEELFLESDRKIAATSDYMSARREEALAERTMQLTHLATLGLGVSLALALVQLWSPSEFAGLWVVLWSAAFVIMLAVGSESALKAEWALWVAVAGIALVMAFVGWWTGGPPLWVLVGVGLVWAGVIRLWERRKT